VEGRLSPAPDTHVRAVPGNELQFWIHLISSTVCTWGKLRITECVFKDCNVDNLEQIEERGLYAKNNFFEHPLQQMRAGFENKLAQALAASGGEGEVRCELSSPR
jgi:hypothetical protein